MGQYNSVIDRFENRKVPLDSACLKEYLMALTKLGYFDRIDQAIESLLPRKSAESMAIGQNRPTSPGPLSKGTVSRPDVLVKD
jgi:hypothetical protein